MILFVLLFALVQCYGEPDTDGRPNTGERLSVDMINAVRMSPSGYKSIPEYSSYSPSLSGVINSGTYPAVNPLWHSYGLTSAGVAHSEDMSTNCGLQHNSCDGTSWSDRIRNYYDCGGISENIAYGYTSGLSTVAQFLCDKSGSTCCPDGDSCDGHRANIMRSSSTEVGIGSASTYWWTQDFGSCNLEGYSIEDEGILSGSFFETGGDIWFVCSFWYSSPADVAYVVIDGYGYTMTKEYSGPNDYQGHYRYELSEDITDCKEYYFRFTAGSKEFIYPSEGSFLTYKSGGVCDYHYTDGQNFDGADGGGDDGGGINGVDKSGTLDSSTGAAFGAGFGATFGPLAGIMGFAIGTILCCGYCLICCFVFWGVIVGGVLSVGSGGVYGIKKYQENQEKKPKSSTKTKTKKEKKEKKKKEKEKKEVKMKKMKKKPPLPPKKKSQRPKLPKKPSGSIAKRMKNFE